MKIDHANVGAVPALTLEADLGLGPDPAHEAEDEAVLDLAPITVVPAPSSPDHVRGPEVGSLPVVAQVKVVARAKADLVPIVHGRDP